MLPAILLLSPAVAPRAAPAPSQDWPGDRMAAAYFAAETARVSSNSLAPVRDLGEWTARRGDLRRQAAEMLGLDPLPERTDLRAAVTGVITQETFLVEKLHFQSIPGLYVTANLYRPRAPSAPAPAVLYLCGHSSVVTNGVSCGNKTGYQHHGAWFARHGYVCLVVDTVQLGEIRGEHHGTYRLGQWGWNARGYTPAGVEAWTGIRALDYLATRPEVDRKRIGVTGRSGGGSYSWTIAALDDRVAAVAPVAGITDLRNHVVDGTIEGHCDCMFLVNTHRWDYPLLAALCAPRPLLLVNTDADPIFPLDGVMRTHDFLRSVYALYGASTNLGLVIGPGPHQDTQDLQVPVFRWFNRHLKGEDPPIADAAVKVFAPADLRALDRIPPDQINTNVQSLWGRMAPAPTVPDSAAAWSNRCAAWRDGLRAKCFAGWPDEPGPLEVAPAFAERAGGVRFEAWDYTSQPHVRLRLYVMRAASRPSAVRLVVGDGAGLGPTNRLSSAAGTHITEALIAAGLPSVGAAAHQLQDGAALAVVVPRHLGLTSWSGDAKRQTHMRRRFMLLGQTVDGMRVWDIRRAVQALRDRKEYARVPLTLAGRGDAGVHALYASLFEPAIAALALDSIPATHRSGPDYLNVLKVLDIPQAVAIAADRGAVELTGSDEAGAYAASVGRALGWPADRVRLGPPVAAVPHPAGTCDGAARPQPGLNQPVPLRKSSRP